MDQTFKEWIAEVNRILKTNYGISMEDMTDFCSRDAYESGSTPIEAAIECLENDDIGQSMLEELGEPME